MLKNPRIGLLQYYNYFIIFYHNYSVLKNIILRNNIMFAGGSTF